MEKTQIKDKKILKWAKEIEKKEKRGEVNFAQSSFFTIKPMNLGKFYCNGGKECK